MARSEVSEPDAWPPPVGVGTGWRDVPLLRPRPGVAGVRQVRLWGQDVLIDVEGLVYCPQCRELFDVELLGRWWDNPHSIGLRRRPGVVVPLPDNGQPLDDEERDDVDAAERAWPL